jgi:deazaflavin-dependent oxidoreductase (nitroreductase family)
VKDATARRLSRLHTTLFRATGGLIGKRLVANDMLLLTTTGRRTGKAHTVPLLYLQDGRRFVVFASWGGRDAHPHWYENLRADPHATVQVPGTTRAVVAVTAGGRERELWWRNAVAAYGGYSQYQAHTDREIPVVFLEDAENRPPPS